MATTAAPAANPRIWLAWKLMLPTAEPSTNMSPGSSAAGADEKGAPASTVQNSSPQSAGNGMPRDRHQPDRADPEHVAGDHVPAARAQVR